MVVLRNTLIFTWPTKEFRHGQNAIPRPWTDCAEQFRHVFKYPSFFLEAPVQ